MLKRNESNNCIPGPYHLEPSVTLFKTPHDQGAGQASDGGSLEVDCGAGHGWEPPDSGRFRRHRPGQGGLERDCGPSVYTSTSYKGRLATHLGLGGARGHAHIAPPNTYTIKTQHRRGHPPRGPARRSRVQKPLVCVYRGHLPGSTVGRCAPRAARS